MAKAILKFDLEDLEDRRSHLRCVKSFDLSYIIWEFVHNSRKKLKNEEKYTVDDVFDHFHSLLEKHNINIEELID